MLIYLKISLVVLHAFWYIRVDSLQTQQEQGFTQRLKAAYMRQETEKKIIVRGTLITETVNQKRCGVHTSTLFL